MKRTLVILALIAAAVTGPRAAQADRADTIFVGQFNPNLSNGYSHRTDPALLRDWTGQRLAGIIVDCYGPTGAAADSTTLDSLAFEVLVQGGSGGGDVIDADDSDAQLGGWFCTTMDSASLVLPGNLTPITGAASTQPKYPYDVFSRHLFTKARKQASGVDIPGRASFRTDGTASATRRSFVIQFNDGFGARQVASKRMAVMVLFRHPRKVPALMRILAIRENS